MCNRSFRCLIVIFAATAALFAWNSPVAGLGPEPGDIYREYTKNLYESTWRVTDPKSTAAGAKEFLPNPVMNLKIEDLEGALRAELVIDRWGGHPGTRDKWVRFNDNDWLVVPELATPKYPTSMVSQDNPIIEVPLEHINEGSNTFNGTCSMLSHWWGQWGWYGIVLRVYFDESKPHPTGRITSPADGGEFGEFPLVAAEASSDAGIARVDFLGWYDSYDVDGDGYYTGWQHYYYGTNITEHLGTAKQGPYKVEWDTEWVPDQEPGSIKMLARIRDNNGYWYVTEAVEGLSLVRDTVSVQLYKAYNLPRSFIARAGKDLSCLIDLPETEPLGMIKKVGLHLRTWNGLDQKIRVNNVYAGLVPGRNHKFSYAVREISPDLPAPGENKISFRNDTEQHGCEVLWPGPGLTIRYKVFQPEKDATCDFNGDGAAGLDDLIDMVLLAHRYRYDPRTDWNRDGHFEINDVVMEGTCPDASVLLAAEGNPGPVTRL